MLAQSSGGGGAHPSANHCHPHFNISLEIVVILRSGLVFFSWQFSRYPVFAMFFGPGSAHSLILALVVHLARVAETSNCSLTPPSARANDCDGGGCECWCTPSEGAFTIWQWAPSGPIPGGPGTCCYDPASDPPCFAARPLVSNTLGSHMVLQAAPRTAQIFGWAAPGDTISVSLAAADTAATPQRHTARASSSDGYWMVQLSPVAASATQYNVSVRSAALDDGVVLVDVLFGELWMCGGQSNMVRRDLLLLLYDVGIPPPLHCAIASTMLDPPPRVARTRPNLPDPAAPAGR